MIGRGTVLNDTYVVRDRIGSGGGGVIYLAYHRRLQTNVVIKQIRDDIRSFVDVRAEVDLLKSLRHSFLPQVYDFLEYEDGIYTVMEYIPGQNLLEALKKNGPVPEKMVLRWAEQLADALQYLHTRKPPVIHSDIKPANIMLTPDGSICLIDFNISMTGEGGRKKTIGVSPRYSPPEQYGSLQKYLRDMNAESLSASTAGAGNRGASELLRELQGLTGRGVDGRSDLFSLGMTLYTLLTGRTADLQDVLQHPVNYWNPSVSEELSAVIRILMSLRPKDRFGSAAEFQYALKHLDRYGRSYKAKKRKQTLIAAAAAGAVLLLGGGVLTGISFRNTKRREQYRSLVSQALEVQREDYDKALQYLGEAVKLFPEEPDAYLAEMSVRNSRLEYEETLDFAVGTALPAVMGLSDNGQFNYLVAEAYDGMGEEQEAVRYYGKAAEKSGGASGFLQDYIVALIRTGNTEEAERQMEVFEEGGGDESLGCFLRAMLENKAGHADQAEKEALEGLKTASDDRLKKALVLFLSDLYEAEAAGAADRKEEKRELYEKRLSVLSDAAEGFGSRDLELLEKRAAARYELARLEENREALDRAAADFEELLKLGLTRAYLYQNIALIREAAGEYEEAGRVLREMRESFPEDYRGWYRSALLELELQAEKPAEQRDYSAAVSFYREAEKLTKGTADAQELLPLAGKLGELGVLR